MSMIPHLPLEILSMIILLTDDVKNVERVCKDWLLTSRRRLYLTSVNKAPIEILARYPKLIRCEPTLILGLFDKENRKRMFERAAQMQTLNLTVVMRNPSKKQEARVFNQIIKGVIGLKCQTTITVLCPSKMEWTTLSNGYVGHYTIQQHNMTICTVRGSLIDGIAQTFSKMTKGLGCISLIDYPGMLSWNLDLKDIKLSKLTVKYHDYDSSARMISSANKVDEIVFLYDCRRKYTICSGQGHQGKITYMLNPDR